LKAQANGETFNSTASTHHNNSNSNNNNTKNTARASNASSTSTNDWKVQQSPVHETSTTQKPLDTPIKNTNTAAVTSSFFTGGTSSGITSSDISVSAEQLVLRAALRLAQDAAASEILGMFAQGRERLEQAALLIDALLLDSGMMRHIGLFVNSSTTASAAGGDTQQRIR
jgi:hypothetical protein